MSKIELYFIHRPLKLSKVGQMRTFIQEYLRKLKTYYEIDGRIFV